MKRRPFLKQASVGIASLPLALNAGGWNIVQQNNWKASLQLLCRHCKIKSTPSFLCFQFMPELPEEVKSGEFKKADDNFYFYNQEQCCFRIFEKTHRDVGVLALLIPFWSKQSDGSWKKVACLSQYELQALAIACKEQPQFNSHDLLPVASAQRSRPEMHITEKGTVGMRTLLGDDNKITCHLQVSSNATMVLQSSFSISASGAV